MHSNRSYSQVAPFAATFLVATATTGFIAMSPTLAAADASSVTAAVICAAVVLASLGGFASILGRRSVQLLPEHHTRFATIDSRERPSLVIIQLRPPLRCHGEKLSGSVLDAAAIFAQRYHRAIDQAAATLRRLLTHVRKRDSDAIIFAFADHGLRHAQEADLTPSSVQDRLAVVRATSNPDARSDLIPNYSPAVIVTTAEIAAALIGCIAGSRSAHGQLHPRRAQIDGQTTGLTAYAYNWETTIGYDSYQHD